MSAGVVLPVALVVLALLDGAFASFRAAAGHHATLPAMRANLEATGWGIAAALMGLAGIALVSVPWLVPAATRSERYDAMVTAGAVLLACYAPMVVVNLIAVTVYFTAAYDWRTFAMMFVLGPFTMLRPVVIALGALAAIVWTADPVVVPGVLVAVAVAIGLGPALSWVRFRRHWSAWTT